MWLLTSVFDRDFDTNIPYIFLGVFDIYIKVVVIVKPSRIQNFVFVFFYGSLPVNFEQIVVRIWSMSVLIQVLHIRMSRSIIEVVIQLFNILPMVSLGSRQSKQPFLENGIIPIPHSECKAYSTFFIRYSGNPVFSPSVNSTSGVIMRKIIPRTTVRAIIFPNRTPLSLTEIGTPFQPVFPSTIMFLQSFLFKFHNSSLYLQNIRGFKRLQIWENTST